VRKLEKDFTALELQHVPRADNSAADDLSVKASTWAPVPEGVFERWLLRPTAQPAELGEGGETSTSKLAVPVVSQNPPKTVCATGGPASPLAPQPISQSGPDAWISEIRDYLKEKILPEDHVCGWLNSTRWWKGISTAAAPTTFTCGALPRRRVVSCLRRSMEESAEVIHHPAHWSVRPSGMASTGQSLSRMQLRW
jgi:hypothetical protein